MKLHPLEIGICPVSGEEIERSSTWAYSRESHFFSEFGVIGGNLLLSRSTGHWNRQDMEARFAIIQSIIADLGLAKQRWVLVEDFHFAHPTDAESRRYYIAMSRELPGLQGIAFCETSPELKVVIKLAVTLYQLPFAVEIVPKLTDALAQGYAWLGRGPAVPLVKHQVTGPIATTPESGLDELIHILGEVTWDKPGGQTFSNFNSASSWKPVVDALSLLKQDLDGLMSRRQARLYAMTARFKHEQSLQNRMTQALQESKRVHESMLREAQRHMTLSQIMVDSQKEILFTLGEIIESRSRETANHIRRVSEYTFLLANQLGLSSHESICIQHASPMHDAGKIVIPDAILNKPGKLTPEEFEVMKNHAKHGFELLKGSKQEILHSAAIIAYQHHEKWNGKGYPNGLVGENIHLYGRITALADVFDALGSDRCYKKAWEMDRVLQLIHEERAQHFDPKLVDLFFEHLPEFLQIRERFPDVAS